MSFAPVAVFVYNRRYLLERTIKSLAENIEAADTDLYIFSDGWKGEPDKPGVIEVRNFIHSISGFKSVTITEAPENKGLGKSIIAGVDEMIKKFGEVIVLEDDLLLSPYFLKYMNDGLNVYRNSDKVASIHAYMYPTKSKLPETFFIKGADCLGWGTWARAWKLFEKDPKKLYDTLVDSKQMDEFNFNGAAFKEGIFKKLMSGRNDSWAVRWDASVFLANKLTLYPGMSLVHHLGSDGGGTNTGKTKKLDVVLNMNPVNLQKIDEIPSPEGYLAIGKFYLSFKAYNPIKRIIFFLKSKNMIPRR